jgi:hypothetical protein
MYNSLTTYDRLKPFLETALEVEYLKAVGQFSGLVARVY